MRKCITKQQVFKQPIFNITTPEIERINGSDLINKLSFCYENYAIEDTIVITRSNRLANLYNKGIRNQVFQAESEISNNDLILITKNHYCENNQSETIKFIANGDICRIKKLYKYQSLYGFSFAQAIIQFDDINEEFETKILIDSLYCDTTESVNNLNKQLKETIL